MFSLNQHVHLDLTIATLVAKLVQGTFGKQDLKISLLM